MRKARSQAVGNPALIGLSSDGRAEGDVGGLTTLPMEGSFACVRHRGSSDGVLLEVLSSSSLFSIINPLVTAGALALALLSLPSGAANHRIDAGPALSACLLRKVRNVTRGV
jgi:hypothetical protein